jgi:hypothetical protein
VLQNEATYNPEIINATEYLNTKYLADNLINIVKKHESHLPNINSTIKRAAQVAEELNQSNEISDTKRKIFKV